MDGIGPFFVSNAIYEVGNCTRTRSRMECGSIAASTCPHDPKHQKCLYAECVLYRRAEMGLKDCGSFVIQAVSVNFLANESAKWRKLSIFRGLVLMGVLIFFLSQEGNTNV